MLRTVFCWEMGANYGHIAGFLPIYKELKRRGVDIWLIVRDNTHVHLLGDEAVKQCLQAPSPRFNPAPRDLHTFADLLAQIGYLNEQVLSHYVLDWCELILPLNPDWIISDHAPTAQLAARALGIPACLIGTGFILPPVQKFCPPLFSEFAQSVNQLDEKILGTMNKLLALFKAEPYQEIGDLFNSSRQFLCSFAEQDHYGVRSNFHYWGALFDSSFGEEFALPSGAEFYSFAYLTSKIKDFERAVAAVANLPGFKLLHIPAADKNIIEQFSDRNDVVIKSAPVLLSSVFDRVDLVVHQGGMGVSAQCLLKGIPQVLIPTQTEQRMLARQMLTQNIAKAVDHHKNPSFDIVFQEALVDHELRAKTKLLKQKYAGFSQQIQIENMVDEMHKFAGLTTS
jgi:UDP:flavonoid glycosyltransferase YjiC (YdhE family)